MLELKGVIPALTLPFREDESIDLDGYRRLIDIVIDDGVHGILANGCTGESWAIDDDERARVFRASVEQVRGRVPVVAGCGAMRTRHAIAKVHQAMDAGCDVVMVQPPWYVMPGEDEIYDYYRAVIAASELPVMIYNIPRRTGINLSVDLVDRLADEPKVIALKESSKDWLVLSAMIRRVRDRVSVFAGYASLLGMAAISEGAVGYVDSTTPVVGRLSIDFYDACVSGDMETARRLQATLARLNFFGTGTFPATVKAALDMLGRPGGFPREPIKPLTSAQREAVRELLIDAGLLAADSGNQAAE
jgi:4-hydroxy-tetrahydrodipicolinate synthase